MWAALNVYGIAPCKYFHWLIDFKVIAVSKKKSSILSAGCINCKDSWMVYIQSYTVHKREESTLLLF